MDPTPPASPLTPDELCQKLLRVAAEALDRLSEAGDAKLTFAEIARALELASKFSRLDAERQAAAAPTTGPLEAEFKAAIEKIYGTPETPQP